MKGISSWLSPKVSVGESSISGSGLYAKKYIVKDEVIAVKGGHIIDKEYFVTLTDTCKRAALQVSDTMFLAPIEEEEIARVMVYINHACNPNVGLRGHLETVAMRDIQPGEELTGDYCVAYSDEFFEFECRCGDIGCRGKVTSNDWKDKALQQKYAGYFCQYIDNKIRNPLST